jgi:hypothetical protein
MLIYAVTEQLQFKLGETNQLTLQQRWYLIQKISDLTESME